VRAVLAGGRKKEIQQIADIFFIKCQSCNILLVKSSFRSVHKIIF